MIKTHKAGADHARALIAHGKVSDQPFTFDKADRDELLGPKGTHVEEFARHHLGEDDSAEETDPKRYRYAFAKDGRCHTRALRSICDRAKEQGHDEVRATAQELIGLIEDGGGDTDHKAATGEEGIDADRSGTPPNAERRYVRGLELRAAADGKGPGTVVGYGAVFGRLSEDLGGFREQIQPGAFGEVLSQDIRALANHDPRLLLGRTKSKTLRMREDDIGVRVEIDLPDTQAGRDTAASIRRGDMDGMSFSFVIDPGDDEWDFRSEPPVRTIHRFRKAYDFGPVTFPAYPDTKAAMRSLDEAMRAISRARAEIRGAPVPSPQAPPPADLRDSSLVNAKARQRLAEALLIS